MACRQVVQLIPVGRNVEQPVDHGAVLPMPPQLHRVVSPSQLVLALDASFPAFAIAIRRWSLLPSWVGWQRGIGPRRPRPDMLKPTARWALARLRASTCEGVSWLSCSVADWLRSLCQRGVVDERQQRHAVELPAWVGTGNPQDFHHRRQDVRGHRREVRDVVGPRAEFRRPFHH